MLCGVIAAALVSRNLEVLIQACIDEDVLLFFKLIFYILLV